MVFLLTGTFWLIVQLFEYIDWDKGRQKAVLLLVMVSACLVMLVINHRLSSPIQESQMVTKTAAAWWIPTLLIISTIIAYYITSASVVILTVEAGVILLIIVGPFFGFLIGVRIDPIDRYLPIGAIAFCALAFLSRLILFLYYVDSPSLIDIAQTTLEAVYAVLNGHNPYTIAIDPHPDYPSYYGYKYLPVTILTFMPLGSLFGATGIRLTNFFLDVITAILIGILARRQLGWFCGTLGAALYLMLPTLPRDLYMNAVTDLAPTLPLLAAMVLYQTRPGLAGAAIGLSVSAKLMPGLLFLVFCFPKLGCSRYFGGFLLGLIPAAVFFVLAPSDFIQNIVWFIAMRPIDTTSWLYGAPSYLISGARLAFGLIMAAVFFVVIYRPPDFFGRCALGVLCINAALLAGPTIHNNYMFWWIPFFCILLSVVLSRILLRPNP
jgi:hypothetical protein